MKKPKLIVILALILLIIIVLAQNAKAVEVRFLFWDFATSAFVMYLIFYILGVASAIIGMFWRRI